MSLSGSPYVVEPRSHEHSNWEGPKPERSVHSLGIAAAAAAVRRALAFVPPSRAISSGAPGSAAPKRSRCCAMSQPVSADPGQCRERIPFAQSVWRDVCKSAHSDPRQHWTGGRGRIVTSNCGGADLKTKQPPSARFRSCPYARITRAGCKSTRDLTSAWRKRSRLKNQSRSVAQFSSRALSVLMEESTYSSRM